MYYASRPDLVIYHRSRLVAAIITAAKQQDDDQDEDDKDGSTILTGGVTENKKGAHFDIRGQLLGRMAKCAGDIAWHFIRTTRDNPIFHGIELYGLCIYLEKRFCTAHKLKMDFIKHESIH